MPRAFKHQLCEGYDPKLVAETLANRGHLAKEEDGRNTVRRYLPGTTKQQRVYAIKSSILDGDLEL